MSERLSDIQSQIEHWQEVKEQAAQTLMDANHRLLELRSQQNSRIVALGRLTLIENTWDGGWDERTM